LAPLRVDHRGDEVLASPLADLYHEALVEADRADVAEKLGKLNRQQCPRLEEDLVCDEGRAQLPANPNVWPTT